MQQSYMSAPYVCVWSVNGKYLPYYKHGTGLSQKTLLPLLGIQLVQLSQSVHGVHQLQDVLGSYFISIRHRLLQGINSFFCVGLLSTGICFSNSRQSMAMMKYSKIPGHGSVKISTSDHSEGCWSAQFASGRSNAIAFHSTEWPLGSWSSSDA